MRQAPLLVVALLASAVGLGCNKNDPESNKRDLEAQLQGKVVELKKVESELDASRKQFSDQSVELAQQKKAAEEAKSQLADASRKHGEIKAEQEAALSKARENAEKFAKQARKLAEAHLQFAEHQATPRAYLSYLAADYDAGDLKAKARGSLFKKVVDADLVQGYRQFADQFPGTPEAELASRRLCEIAYTIARNEDTLDSCAAFLRNFNAAPKEFRDGALDLAIKLEEARISKKINDDLGQQLTPDQRKNTFWEVNRINEESTTLYIEAVAARKVGNEELFLIKYQTVQRAPLFAKSHGRFFISQNENLQKSIDEIISRLDKVSADATAAAQFNAKRFAEVLTRLDLLEALQKQIAKKQVSDEEAHRVMKDRQLEQIASLHYLRKLMAEQSLLIGSQKDSWIEYVELGANVLPLLKPASTLVKGLRPAVYLLNRAK